EPEPLLPRRSPVLTDSQLPLPVADAPLEADRLCSGEHERFQDEAPARRELAGGGSNRAPPIRQPGQVRDGIGRRDDEAEAAVEARLSEIGGDEPRPAGARGASGPREEVEGDVHPHRGGGSRQAARHPAVSTADFENAPGAPPPDEILPEREI